ncbi:hypothetical protein HDV05_002575 [Chytridiales sp. JEL 0842]|nr:hypothetical protein HDV05_002575 [Chytridiales sp. JEL 0842]
MLVRRTTSTILPRLASSAWSSIGSRAAAVECSRNASWTLNQHCASLLPAQTLQTKRFYYRKQYLKEKKLRRAQENQEDVTLEDAISVLRTYSLGQDKPVSAHVFCMKPEEGTKPVRGSLVLPTPVAAKADKSIILVFAKGPQAEEAKSLGAHIVGGEELVAQVASGQVQFDRCLATREMFPQVVKIAKILGPKGLMPSPARGTVSDDVKSMMASMQATSNFEMDADQVVTLAIGATAWTDQNLIGNLRALFKAILDARPPKTDISKFIESVNISAPLTPGLKLPLRPFRDLTKNKK